MTANKRVNLTGGTVRPMTVTGSEDIMSIGTKSSFSPGKLPIRYTIFWGMDCSG